LKTIWHYNKFLPAFDESSRITIGEGQTPLIRSRYVGPLLGLANLFFKLENLNPTGSYKDRFAAAFVSSLVQKKSSFCLATSSGNTGAALAAYCAAAQIECFIIVVDGAPEAKLQQMQFYGGKTIMVEDFGLNTSITNNVFETLEKYTKTRNVSLPISAYRYCTEGMLGVQTIAYEILDELNGKIKHVFSPAGGGGLTLAMAKGMIAYGSKGDCKVHCVQPAGNNTIAGALASGSERATEITHSITQISGLQVPGILDGTNTIRFCRESGGTGVLVNDESVFETQRLLAQKEGIFCEPAGAVSVQGVIEAVKKGFMGANDNIVCLITGSGFKDMNIVSRAISPLAKEKKYNVNQFLDFLATIE
jgi:threonine synthase